MPQSRAFTDPILTNLAQGYGSPFNFVGTKLFPIVQVEKAEGRYMNYGNENYVAHSEDTMAIGMGAKPHYIDFQLSTTAYLLDFWGLGSKLFQEELNQADAKLVVKLKQLKTYLTTDGMAVFLEKMLADMAQDDANYTNFNTLDNTGVGKYKWSHASADPIANVQAGVAAIRAATGLVPDTMVLGYDAAVQLTKIESIQKLVAPYYPSAVTVVLQSAVEKLAAVAGIKNVFIGESMYAVSPGATLNNMWNDNCILAFVGQNVMSDTNYRNFGALLRRKGSPKIQTEIIGESDDTLAIINRDVFKPFFIDELCGYLIEDCV